MSFLISEGFFKETLLLEGRGANFCKFNVQAPRDTYTYPQKTLKLSVVHLRKTRW